MPTGLKVEYDCIQLKWLYAKECQGLAMNVLISWLYANKSQGWVNLQYRWLNAKVSQGLKWLFQYQWILINIVLSLIFSVHLSLSEPGTLQEPASQEQRKSDSMSIDVTENLFTSDWMSKSECLNGQWLNVN